MSVNEQYRGIHVQMLLPVRLRSAGAEFPPRSTSVKRLDPEVPAIFPRQGNLSCSNCHINWFCLTEPDLQHFQDVNFSL